MREREIGFNHFSVFGEGCLQIWIKAMMFCLGGFAKPLASKWFVAIWLQNSPQKGFIWPATSSLCGAHLVHFQLPSLSLVKL